jgi:HJR/Mrr/RecB family endonuclease
LGDAALNVNSVKEFRVGEQYTNDEIRFALELENLGGIRPSVDARKNLRHLAILTAAEESGRLLSENPYNDRIEGDILTYTAQGREGNQRLLGRNKRLIEQYSIPVPFFGFINVGRQTYRFLGLLELLRHYQEMQADKRGVLRKVWLFEFRIHGNPSIVPIEQAAAISGRLLNESRKMNVLTDLEREVAELDEAMSDNRCDLYEIENIRSKLVQVPPYSFEHLVKSLMEKNGFCDVSVTAMSGDGGIDINAYVDKANDFFGGTHVQAQVKRWRHAIGNVEINNFRGALSTTAKGVFITTRHYTRAAIMEAQHKSKLSITLIDGPKLSSLVIRCGLNIEIFTLQLHKILIKNVVITSQNGLLIG